MEYIKKCNVCGHIWCYTDNDIKNNETNSALAAFSSLGAVVNAIGGTKYDAYEQSKIADKSLNKLVDYNKCPSCNSTNTRTISREEYEKIKKIEEKRKNGFAPNATAESLMKRIEIFIEEKDWASAELYIEQVIDMEPDNANVYMLSLFIEYKVTNEFELIDFCSKNKIILENNKNFKYIQKFGKNDIIDKISNINNEVKRYTKILNEEEIEKKYTNAINNAEHSSNISELNDILDELKEIGDYKETKNECDKVSKKITMLEEEKKEKRNVLIKKYFKIFAIVLTICIAIYLIILLLYNVIIPNIKYLKANKAYESKEYNEAVKLYEELGEYKDAKSKLKDAKTAKNNNENEKTIEEAKELASNNKYEEALNLIKNMDYNIKKDVENEINYNYSNYLMEDKPEKAYEIFISIGEFKDSKEKALISAKKLAKIYEEKESYRMAYEWYSKGNDENTGLELLYSYVNSNRDRKNENTYIFLEILTQKQYKDSQSIYNELYKKNVNVVMNKSADSLEPLNHTSSSGVIYVHYKVSGLHPGETYKIHGMCEEKLEYRSDTDWTDVKDFEIKYEEDDVWKMVMLTSGGSVAWKKYYLYEYDYKKYKKGAVLGTSNKMTFDENY